MIRIGPYRLGPLLGAGGMGSVYRGEHETLGVHVAVKVLPAAARHGFEGEVAALAALVHPGIVQIVDRGVLEADQGPLRAGTPWLAMELLASDLATRPPSPSRLLPVLDQTLKALAHAHGSGLLHLDLKPSNLLWRDDAVVIADFGLARRQPGSISHVSAEFAAPEQLADEPTGPWTDLYALGRTAAWWSTPDSALHRWIERASAPDPADRFASAAQAHAALPRSTSSLSADPTTVATSDPIAPTRRRDPDAPATTGSLPAVPWIEPSETPPPPAPVRPLHRGAGLGVVQQRALPLVGREAQQQRLWDALRTAARDRRAVTVALRGPSGSGRTSLAAWLAREAHGDCGALVLDLPPHEDLGSALRTAVRRHPLGAHCDGLARTWSQGLLPPSLTLRGLQAWIDGRLTVVLAEHPDAAELSALEAPVVVVGPALAGAEVEVVLGPLPDAALQQALGALLGLDAPTAHTLARSASGNPGVALALVNHAIASGALRPSAHGLAQHGPLQLPESALQPVRARYSRFPPDERDVLAFAAALGPEIDESLLPEPRATTVARALAEGIWTKAGPRWSWASTALREAALASGSRPPAEVHRAVAAAVTDPLDRGLQLALAGDPSAIGPLYIGFKAALARQEVASAARATRLAAQLPLEAGDRRPALMRARLAWTQNHDDTAEAALVSVEPHLDDLDLDQRNDFHLVRGNLLTNRMQLEDALATYDRVQLQGSATEAYHLAHGRARALGWLHREREALAVVDTALTDPTLTPRRTHDLQLVRGTTLHTLQRLDEAETAYRSLLDATPVLAYQAASNLADLLRQRGNDEPARSMYDRARQLAAAAGTELSFATVCAPTLDAVAQPSLAYRRLREAIAATASDAVAAFGHFGCLQCCPDGEAWDRHWTEGFRLLPRLPSDPDSTWFMERARAHAVRRGWTERAAAVETLLRGL